MSGEECKKLRKSLKLTQQEFADRLGVSRFLVVKGERKGASVLLSQAIASMVAQGEVEHLRLQVKVQAEHIKALKKCLKGGAAKMADELHRLQTENANQARTIEIMMAARKSIKASAS